MLIAMQFYYDDLKAAMETARLMADIEDEQRDDDFIFFARKGCEAEKKTVAHVAEKFRNVISITGRRAETGWPAGPNCVWHELMNWCLLENRDDKKWDMVLTTESDAVPLAKDWIDQLKREWEKAGKLVVGHHLPLPPFPHINGNAMFDPEINAKIPQMYGTPLGKTWDCYHAPKLIANGFDSPLIVSRHRTKTITEDELYEPREPGIAPVFFHGCKDSSARDIVRKKLCSPKT